MQCGKTRRELKLCNDRDGATALYKHDGRGATLFWECCDQASIESRPQAELNTSFAPVLLYFFSAGPKERMCLTSAVISAADSVSLKPGMMPLPSLMLSSIC